MRKQLLLLVVLAFSVVKLFAQQYDSILKLLDTKYPQEKLYLQFDKSVYSPGETIWFKAYLFSGVSPSQISKTMYAELLDAQGKLLQRKSAPIILSGAAAAFDLPTNLKTKAVYVRAYTRWMLNFDTSFLYVKSIPIAAKSKTTDSAQPQAAFLQFLPEGGNMVAGLEFKVAFKATDSRGLPIPVKGVVISSTGKRITAFSSMHDGMGYFFIIPVAGEQYKARWRDQFGEQHETPLPVHQPEGIMFSVETVGDKLNYLIVKSPGYKLSEVHVVAQLQQQPLYSAKASMAIANAVYGSIPLKNVPAGIMQLTLFNENGLPLAERLCFTNLRDYNFKTDVNAAQKDLAKRAKNIIEIDVPDTLMCNLSVAVTDAGLNPVQQHEDNILSHILLTSDIKGYVHQPAYYFSGADSAAEYLDLVMLTNGWRRFRWEDVLAGRFPELKQQPEDYLAVEGKVSGLNPIQMRQLELSAIAESKNSGRNYFTVPVQADGSFKVQGLTLYDTIYFHYRFHRDRDRILTDLGVFKFWNSLFTDTLFTKLGAFTPDTTVILQNEDLSQKKLEDTTRKVQTLATVHVVEKQKTKVEKMEEEYTNGLFSTPGNTFVIDNNPTALLAGDVIHYLMGRVAGLKITFHRKEPVVTFDRDKDQSPPVYFLNEMLVDDASDIQDLPMTEVAMIKVFPPPFMGAPFDRGAQGAIAVYTKKAGSNLQDIKGFDGTKLMGYSPLREFYSPDYSKNDTTAIDHRTTLYWDPFVFTDKENKRIQITFYNNDITSKMRVVMEGINANGKLTHIEKIIE